MNWISALGASNSTAAKDFPSFGNKDDQVDHVDPSLAQQSDQPSDRPLNLEPFSKSEVDQQTQQNDEIGDLVEYIRLAIEAGDRETALDIQKILKEVCSQGAADRQKVWGNLTEAEKAAFLFLLSTPEPTPEPTLEATAEATLEPSLELTPAGEEVGATAGTIDEKDAETLREIATIWWDEYYPEQLQNLLTQMYGWKAPGVKYQKEEIVDWLAGETAQVRDRINVLITEKNRHEETES